MQLCRLSANIMIADWSKLQADKPGAATPAAAIAVPHGTPSPAYTIAIRWGTLIGSVTLCCHTLRQHLGVRGYWEPR